MTNIAQICVEGVLETLTGGAGRKAQMNPLSYGGTPIHLVYGKRLQTHEQLIMSLLP